MAEATEGPDARSDSREAIRRAAEAHAAQGKRDDERHSEESAVWQELEQELREAISTVVLTARSQGVQIIQTSFGDGRIHVERDHWIGIGSEDRVYWNVDSTSVDPVSLRQRTHTSRYNNIADWNLILTGELAQRVSETRVLVLDALGRFVADNHVDLDFTPNDRAAQIARYVDGLTGLYRLIALSLVEPNMSRVNGVMVNRRPEGMTDPEIASEFAALAVSAGLGPDFSSLTFTDKKGRPGKKQRQVSGWILGPHAAVAGEVHGGIQEGVLPHPDFPGAVVCADGAYTFSRPSQLISGCGLLWEPLRSRGEANEPTVRLVGKLRVAVRFEFSRNALQEMNVRLGEPISLPKPPRLMF